MFKKLIGRINLSLIIIKGVKNWPHVFLNYFKLQKNTKKNFVVFKLRNGQEVKIRKPQSQRDTSGIGTIFEIFLMKNYCPKGMEIKDNYTVIDVGANMGVFSLYAGMKARSGKIYAYEPFKIHYNRLLDNIKLNNLTNIRAFNLGISGKKGKKQLFINEKSSGMHSIVFSSNSKSKISINCITLEDIFKQNKIKECNFLKIDCEGAEYEIIFNTKPETFKKIGKISLEFDNIDKERNYFALKKVLETNGFEVKSKGAHKHQGILYARRKI